MTGNFFADNADLQYHLDRLDIQEAVDILEDGYRYHGQYAAAPRNYADAKHNYRLMLNVLGELCAEQFAPRFHLARAGAEALTRRDVHEPRRHHDRQEGHRGVHEPAPAAET